MTGREALKRFKADLTKTLRARGTNADQVHCDYGAEMSKAIEADMRRKSPYSNWTLYRRHRRARQGRQEAMTAGHKLVWTKDTDGYGWTSGPFAIEEGREFYWLSISDPKTDDFFETDEHHFRTLSAAKAAAQRIADAVLANVGVK